MPTTRDAGDNENTVNVKTTNEQKQLDFTTFLEHRLKRPALKIARYCCKLMIFVTPKRHYLCRLTYVCVGYYAGTDILKKSGNSVTNL